MNGNTYELVQFNKRLDDFKMWYKEISEILYIPLTNKDQEIDSKSENIVKHK